MSHLTVYTALQCYFLVLHLFQLFGFGRSFHKVKNAIPEEQLINAAIAAIKLRLLPGQAKPVAV